MEKSAVSKRQDLGDLYKLASDIAKYQSVLLTVTATTAGIFWKHCGSV